MAIMLVAYVTSRFPKPSELCYCGGSVHSFFKPLSCTNFVRVQAGRQGLGLRHVG